MKKILKVLPLFTLTTPLLLTSCGPKGAEDVYEDGKLVLRLKNAYFEAWTGSDTYTETLEEKFKVQIKPSSYDYNNWGTQVENAVNGNNLPDAFHFDLESFNFGNTYKTWAEGKTLKALPSDLSKWPQIQNLMNNVSNNQSLKIDGKYYGIPLIYNQNEADKDFSSFTYVYRRDWVKEIDKKHYNASTSTYDEGFPIFRENDVYTWDEFQNMLKVFKNENSDIGSGNSCAIADVSWGFPSLTNFYKDSPHCYTMRDGKVANAFTTDEYIQGLELTRSLKTQGLYFDQAANSNNTKAYDYYKGGHAAVYYENLSLANYSTLRKDFKNINSTMTKEQIDDATAILKVKGPDGKYHLEGSENWFSMTMFNYDISDTKMEKILDILNYVLSEEGTKLAIYGVEGKDYTMNGDDVELNERVWHKTDDGTYAPIENGAKFIREMVTLNYDTSSFDPFVDADSYEILNKWAKEMKEAKQNNNLVIFQEPSEIKWLSTPKKDNNTSALIEEGNNNAMNFVYLVNGYTTKEEYKSKFAIAKWTDTIAEINSKLGK